LARASRKKSKVTVKEMKFRNDPMIRLYEKTQDWLQERGRPVVYVVFALAGLILIYTAAYYFLAYRHSKAAQAFQAAFEKYNAQVVETPPESPTTKFYTDEKTKWQETAEAFERLAQDYPSYYGTIGRYYAGVAYLHFDRDRGLQVLKQVADKNDQPTSDLATLALAENYAANGETDQAIALYEKLLNSPNVPRQVIQFSVGRAYEKAGNTEKAVEAYFEAAKADRTTAAGSEAEKRLSALAPSRIKELPEPTTLPLPN
jgi:tetratricopeptide (TPR) repeat protein